MRNRQHCARCGTRDSLRAPKPHPRLTIGQCSRCGYFNVASASPQSLPIPESLGIAGAEALSRQLHAIRQAEAEEGGELFRRVARALADAAGRLLVDAPESARAAVPVALARSEAELARHEGRPRGNDLARTATARAAALLFALGARMGDIDFGAQFAPVTSDGERRFRESFWPVATDAAAVGSILHQLERGDLRITIRDGEFISAETDQGLDIAEYLVNRRAAPAPAEFESMQVRALREALALGRNADLRHLLRYALDESGHAREGLLMLPRSKLSEAARATLESFEFTLERVRCQDEPWFLSLLPRRARPLADAELSLSLLSRNWTAYYPIFSGVHEGQPLFVFGPQAVAITLDNLMHNKNRVMQQLAEAPPQSLAADARQRLSALRRQLNRHAEARAAKVLEGCGWKALAGSNWGRAGATEEIDIVAARASANGVDVLVGEVKDFDLTLHRIRGPLGAAQRLRDTDAQLARKLRVALDDVPGVLRRLGVGGDPAPVQVHALLITNDMPPADLLQDFQAADYTGLAEFSRLLREDRELALRLFGRASREVPA